ncbi:MAG: sensor domain-containing diguanylate cyclase [Rhodoferax sp.]|uniref:sensor domain-containing diguanylate cyclase n=1 Tax=Rhodoferax sp. TaxID=50421 RepID=UPI0032657A54
MALSIPSEDPGSTTPSISVATARRLRVGLVLGLVCANLLVLVLSGDSLYLSRQHAVQRAETQTQNIANALDQTVSSDIEKVDLALQAVADELERQLASQGLDEVAMQAFLLRLEQRLPQVEAMRVAQADGLVVLGRGLNKAERSSWLDRDYFGVLRDHPETGLYISKPLVGRVSRQSIIAFARRYNYPDGRFAGVVAAPIAIIHFSQILARFDVGPNGSLILRDADVGLITRVPAIADKPAGQLGHSAVSKEFRQQLQSGARTASYFTAAGADGLERLSTYRYLQQAPMLVVVSMAQRDYLAGWNLEVYRSVVMAGSFLLVSLLLGVFLLRALQQTEKHQRLLEVQLTKISSLQALLQEQAIRDPLTGLFNRRYLDETLARDLTRARREDQPLALALLDLDGFKRINDTYGHLAGDQVLKSLSALLGKGARQTDTICRFGGEEFLAVLPKMSLDQAQHKVDAWRLEFAQTPIAFGDASLHVTFSAGIAAFPQHGADSGELVTCADAALYRAKQAGRNRVLSYEAAAGTPAQPAGQDHDGKNA